MEIPGCDYSWGRPSLSCLAAPPWNKKFVVRYTSGDLSGKNMSPNEVKAIAAAGMAVVTVWQTGKTAPLGGRIRGLSAARESLQIARSCGMPLNRPHYFALDDDPSIFSTSQWTQIDAFYAGAEEVLGDGWVGVYGGLEAIERLVAPSRLRWGWQTYAWSGGVWSLKAQLRQIKNNVTVCNGLIDHDEAKVLDYGGWKPGQVVIGRKFDAEDKTYLTDLFGRVMVA